MRDAALTHDPEGAPPPPGAALVPLGSRALPSGRALELRVADGSEELLVRAPGGEVEVRIAFSREGPVVTVRGGRLEVDTPEEIALSCRSLDVRARESLRLRSDRDARIGVGGDLRVKAEGDVRMNGAFVRLNCDEEFPNPPPPLAGETPVQALERLLAHARRAEAAMASSPGVPSAEAAPVADTAARESRPCCSGGEGISVSDDSHGG